MQEEFEDWAKSKEFDLELNSNPRFPNIRYQDIETQLMWEWWEMVKAIVGREGYVEMMKHLAGIDLNQ